VEAAVKSLTSFPVPGRSRFHPLERVRRGERTQALRAHRILDYGQPFLPLLPDMPEISAMSHRVGVNHPGMDLHTLLITCCTAGLVDEQRVCNSILLRTVSVHAT